MRLIRNIFSGSTLATVVAMTVGFIVTLSLLLDGTGFVRTLLTASGVEDGVRNFAPAALRIVTVTVAFTIFIGLINLIGVHIVRAVYIIRGTEAITGAERRRRVEGTIMSLLLVACTIGVIWITVLERSGDLVPPAGEPAYSSMLRDTVQYSVEASLAGLLAFSLIYGAYRFMRYRVSFESTIFLVALVINLLAQAGFILPGLFENIRLSVIDAGSEGILLGIALATVVAGIRVLIGQDRSFRD